MSVLLPFVTSYSPPSKTPQITHITFPIISQAIRGFCSALKEQRCFDIHPLKEINALPIYDKSTLNFTMIWGI